MGKHFWMKHVVDEPHDKQPGCMFGLVHALDYHHWQSNVRKIIHHRRYEGQTYSKCDWSPETKMFPDDDYEVEKLLDSKETPYLNTKRSRATKRRSLKARIKSLIAEENSKESDNIQGKEGFSLNPNLQRTYSIHHLESLDGGLGKIRTDWKHPIIFLPRNVENCATQSLDTTEMKAAKNQVSSSGKSNMRSSEDAAKPDSNEDPDFLEIFKVDKELLMKHLQDADESIANFSRSALGLNTKVKFSKSRSFPVAEVSQRRKLKPSKLENKQKEVWSFPREDKFQTVSQAPRVDTQRNNEVIMPSAVGADQGKSDRTSLAVELNEVPNKSLPSESFEDVAARKDKSTMDSVGEKPNQNHTRKRIHQRSYSLNESLDKYARLFESSSRTGANLNPSKSLKLTNEYGHAPVYFRRICSLSNVDSYYANLSLEALGDYAFGNGPIITAKDSSSGLRNSKEEEEIVRLLISDRKSVPTNEISKANCQEEPVDRCDPMQTMKDDATLKFHTSDDNRENVEDLKKEEDKLKKSSRLLEPDTICSEIGTKELPDQGVILDSDICLQKMVSHALDFQISEGLDHRSSLFNELNSSVDSNDLKSLHSKSALAYSSSRLNLENDKKFDNIIKCFARDGCPERNNSDLYYVRYLLDQSGIALDPSERSWHESNQPLSPQLFEEVEACWPHDQDQLTAWQDFYGCWHHQMLFDLVNEVLLDVYDISLPYYPNALSSSCHVRPFPVGNHIIEEVSTRIGTLLNLKPDEKQSDDCIVAYDLANDHSWMNLQLETECLALELEDMIFEELLEEVICA